MDTGPKRIDLKVDTYTRVCLTVIAGLLTVLIVGLWAEAPPTGPEARAALGTGIPDSGQQRQRIIKELQSNGEKLDRLIALLKNGQAKVQIAEDPKSKGPNRATPPPKK